MRRMRFILSMAGAALAILLKVAHSAYDGRKHSDRT